MVKFANKNSLERHIERVAKEYTKMESENAMTIDFILFDRKSDNRSYSSASIYGGDVEVLIRLPFVSKDEYTKEKIQKILEGITSEFEESTGFIVSGENTFPKASRKVWAPHIGIEKTTQQRAIQFIDEVIDEASRIYG